jgi:hypothetical protein
MACQLDARSAAMRKRLLHTRRLQRSPCAFSTAARLCLCPNMCLCVHASACLPRPVQIVQPHDSDYSRPVGGSAHADSRLVDKESLWSLFGPGCPGLNQPPGWAIIYNMAPLVSWYVAVHPDGQAWQTCCSYSLPQADRMIRLSNALVSNLFIRHMSVL